MSLLRTPVSTFGVSNHHIVIILELKTNIKNEGRIIVVKIWATTKVYGEPVKMNFHENEKKKNNDQFFSI